MIKRVSLLRRLSHLTHAEFVAHWSGPHIAIVRQMPGVRGLRLNPVQSWTPEGEGWDGVGELWFDSVEAALAAFATEPYRSQLIADRALFTREVQSCFVSELTFIAPPGAG
jgi:uncharacterized protein (TIGR02118 family)